METGPGFLARPVAAVVPNALSKQGRCANQPADGDALLGPVVAIVGIARMLGR